MHRLVVTVSLLVGALACAPRAATPQHDTSRSPEAPRNAEPIAWRRWEKGAFDDARTQRKLIVVTIATEWCHWCHVMDEDTWSDPAIRALVAERFVAIREDADARPDLAERYAA